MLKIFLNIKRLWSIVAISIFLVACGDDQQKEITSDTHRLDTKFVTIVTGGASGPYNIIGTTLAQLYSKNYQVNSKAQATAASIQNLNLINQGKAEVAFVMSDVLSQAISGSEAFPKPLENIAQMAVLYPNYVQIVTSKRSGIKTMDDLRGRRVSVGDLNSGAELNSRTLLNGHGITYDDLKVDFLAYTDAVDALKAGRLDAAILTSGLPNASILELEQGFDLQLVEIRKEMVDEITKDQDYFLSGEIPANTYSNTESIPTAVIVNALVVRKDLNQEDVYKLTKTFFENLGTLSNAHQAAKDISLERAQKGLIAPLHPGAKQYYDEHLHQ